MNKSRIYSLVAGLVLGLTATQAQAKSEFTDFSMEPQWPATTAPGSVVVYQVTIAREGQGLLEVSFSSAGLPEGAIATFSPSVVRFTGREPEIRTALMTINCAAVTATDEVPFTVTGTSQRESITITNSLSLPAFPLAPPAPRLTIQRDDLGISLRGTSGAGQTCQIECTQDLASNSWAPAGFATADGNGRFTFICTNAANIPMNFYRAVVPAPAQPAEQ